MPQLVNTDLLKNPYNWIIVWLMLAFAAFAIALVAPQGRFNLLGTG